MKNKKSVLGLVLATVTLLTGCGAVLPEMTAEQEDKIVEYAAGLVMRHTNDYESRLVDLSLYSNPMEEDDTEEQEKEETGKMDEVADTEIVDVTEEGTMTLEEVLLPAGMELSYLGCRVTDSYPDGAGSDPFFALDATDGKKLVVMQFVIKNHSGQEAEIDVFSQLPMSTLIINGDETVGILSTMLLDDLSTFIGSITDGGEVALVLIAETDCQSTEEISTLKLTIKTKVGKATETLQ